MNTYRCPRPLLTLTVTLLACLPLGTPAKAAASGVDESAKSFSPKRVEIALNEKVVWTNRSSETHTVTFEDGTDLHPTCDPDALLLVGCQGPDATAERTFGAPGSYAYYCKIHRRSGMTGVVLVAAAASTTVTSAPASSTSTTQRATTTTARPTSSTTTTTRVLATSSTLVPSSTTTTTSEATSVLLPGEPPPLTDETSAAANGSGSNDGSEAGTVALIVGLLLAVSAGGGLLLWRLRPGRP